MKPDRTQLTEALLLLDMKGVYITTTEKEVGEAYATAMRAARWAADFPTDEQVEAAAQQIWVFSPSTMTRTKDQWTIISDRRRDRFRQMARSALEAVTMIGDNQ